MSIGAAPLEQALPDYPASALGDEIACSVEILYHVQTDGSVRIVRLDWRLMPPREHLQAFEDALAAAVAGWRFEPAWRYRQVEDEEGKPRFVVQKIPSAQRVLIRFRVEHGQAVVE